MKTQFLLSIALCLLSFFISNPAGSSQPYNETNNQTTIASKSWFDFLVINIQDLFMSDVDKPESQEKQQEEHDDIENELFEYDFERVKNNRYRITKIILLKLILLIVYVTKIMLINHLIIHGLVSI